MLAHFFLAEAEATLFEQAQDSGSDGFELGTLLHIGDVEKIVIFG